LLKLLLSSYMSMVMLYGSCYAKKKWKPKQVIIME